MKLPKLKIAHLEPKYPIIQGGMAIRISTYPLAAAVAEMGGIGLIAASGMEHDELRHEIRSAKKLTDGIVGINIMVAARDFVEVVKIAIEEKIDLIVAGAGFSKDIFKLGRESGIPIVPIVSHVNLAKISERLGAAAIIVEGKEAGGHLGTDRSSREIVPPIIDAVSIPVIAAGGCVDGADFCELMRLGSAGVQMGTRFAASVESNAPDNWKQLYIDSCRKEDVVKIISPVGLPGSALLNPFSESILDGSVPTPSSCDLCLKKCSQKFCIIKALINAQQGDIDNGIVFAGEYVYKIKKILSVKEIFEKLLDEIEKEK